MKKDFETGLSREQIDMLDNLKSKGSIPTCLGNMNPEDEVCEGWIKKNISLCAACNVVSQSKELQTKYKGGTTLKQQADNVEEAKRMVV